MINEGKVEFNPILLDGKLLQQYLVDSWVKVEQGRLNLIRNSQQAPRVEKYRGLMDVMTHATDNEKLEVSHLTILPSSFTVSKRYIAENYHDSMTIVRSKGKPDICLTLTTNPNRIEIKSQLKKGSNR